MLENTRDRSFWAVSFVFYSGYLYQETSLFL